MAAIKRSRLLAAGASLLFSLSGCAFWPWGGGEAAEPAPPSGIALSERRLQDIVEDEARLLERMQAGALATDSEIDRQAAQIRLRYRSYLADHPQDVEGLLLYGKFLRSIGRDEEAFAAFQRVESIDPNLAVTKQQLANHYAEKGQWELALDALLQAVALEPNVAVYHYQLGEVIDTFRDDMMVAGLYERSQLDQQMQSAFRQAAILAPEIRDFGMRYGESFYDVATPDWEAALAWWREQEGRASEPLVRQAIRLHQARVLGNLGRIETARELALSVDTPELQASREALLQDLLLRP